MPTLRLTARRYRSVVQPEWVCGEERDVTEDQAEYLIGTFPSMFEAVKPPRQRTTVPDGAVRKRKRAPAKRGRKGST